MVSLSRSYNTNSGGATFFSESVNMADRDNLMPLWDSFGGFQEVPTVPLFSFHLLVTLILDIVAIVYAVVHPDAGSKCREYFIIIYLHVALWIITFIMHLLTKFLHNKVRLNGYLQFYKSVECHASLPLVVVSLWTVVLLFVQTLMQHYYPDNFSEICLNGGTLSPRAYLCALITVEFCVITGVNISYIMKIVNFNKQKPQADVYNSEWLASFNPAIFSQIEVGYGELGSKVIEFLEKQADLIHYLKEHNAKLNEKVISLSTEMHSKIPENSGTGSSNAEP
ncbi:transmembrane protein 192 [Dendroctonus ponderosae]|uniref:Transmembrane protein 192 n=2 Tax=Dendroctonus ponderosae TaxID=77166 RepID=U4URI6_DENPD|nr:transmembrane protein 192 [Dendroctonus ponderosae]ERL92680.1 hypothetical protein D910_09992 [Dendroctonus ponderosae]